LLFFCFPLQFMIMMVAMKKSVLLLLVFSLCCSAETQEGASSGEPSVIRVRSGSKLNEKPVDPFGIDTPSVRVQRGKAGRQKQTVIQAATEIGSGGKISSGLLQEKTEAKETLEAEITPTEKTMIQSKISTIAEELKHLTDLVSNMAVESRPPCDETCRCKMACEARLTRIVDKAWAEGDFPVATVCAAACPKLMQYMDDDDMSSMGEVNAYQSLEDHQQHRERSLKDSVVSNSAASSIEEAEDSEEEPEDGDDFDETPGLVETEAGDQLFGEDASKKKSFSAGLSKPHYQNTEETSSETQGLEAENADLKKLLKEAGEKMQVKQRIRALKEELHNLRQQA